MKVFKHIHTNFHRYHMHNEEIKGGGKFALPTTSNKFYLHFSMKLEWKKRWGD